MKIDLQTLQIILLICILCLGIIIPIVVQMNKAINRLKVNDQKYGAQIIECYNNMEEKHKQQINALKIAFDDLSKDQYKLIQQTTDLNNQCVAIMKSKLLSPNCNICSRIIAEESQHCEITDCPHK